MSAAEKLQAPLPHVMLTARQYFHDGSFTRAVPEVTDLEHAAMEMCLQLGRQALEEGNPPVGAVLINRSSEGLKSWGAQTADKTSRHLLSHAELAAYNLAHGDVGDDLSSSTLVTSAQPCNTCSAPYAEGKIGKIVYAAPRAVVFGVTGIMRPRKINMHDLLTDGATKTLVVEGYRAAESLEMFATWAARKAAGEVRA